MTNTDVFSPSTAMTTTSKATAPPPTSPSPPSPPPHSSPPKTILSRVLAATAGWSARHVWTVVVGWLVILAALGGLAGTVGGSFRNDMAAPDAPSTWATEQLRTHLPGAPAATARIVADTPSVGDTTAVREALGRAEQLPHVADASVRTNPDGTVAVIDVTYDAALVDLNAMQSTSALKEAAAPLTDAGLTWGVGGELPESVQGPNGVAEAVGVGVALLVLLFVLRSARLAVLPLVVAAVGTGSGIALIMLLAGVVDLSTVTPTLASMVGIGLAIDYSLLLIVRYRRALGGGRTFADAAAHAGATAGHAVLLAGVIVVIGLSGLAWSGVPGFAWMGVGAALVVITSVAASLTLLPALLAALGHRVRPTAPSVEGKGVVNRVCAAVVARPVRSALAAVAVLVLLALPATQARLAQNDAGAEAADNPTRIAYDLMASGFGPGANGPFVVVADANRVDRSELAALSTALERDPAVASATPATTSPDGAVTTWTLLPQWGPQDERTQDFAQRLRAELPAGVAVTGPTAAMLDLTETLGSNLWRVVLGILLPTGFVMLVMFRSLAIPLKAMAANLLSVVAAFGLVTVLFQTDIGAALIGLHGPVPMAAWAPVVLFAILFGLSMDYEVFLVEAIRERYLEHGDNARAVREGLAASGPVITAGAAIMVCVAAGFAADPSVMVKLIGVGLATAIILDVTVMRAVVVPAAMTLLGRWNWWLPGSRMQG